MLVVPVYNMILTPDATLYFPLDQLRRSTGGKGVPVGEKVIFIVAKENFSFADMTNESFYPIGVAGTIREMNHRGFAVIDTQYRVDLEMVEINPDKTISLTLTRRPDIEDLDPAEEAEKLKSLLAEMRKYASGFQWAGTANYIIDQIRSLGMAACSISPMLENSNEERYAILAEDSRAKRAELIEKMLYEHMEVGRIANEAATSQQKENQQRYKESAIKRQMEHLQRELD